jgi:glycosyltransferase involved in cell wall biosynthesis
MAMVTGRTTVPASTAAFRLLVVSSDTYPPKRVDVAVLFGEELASRGHTVDWILQSEGPCSRAYIEAWGGGRVWVGPTDLGASLLRRVHKHLAGIVHDLRLFGRLRSGEYDVIEVKDKFISGVLGLIAARLFHKRFVYWLSYPYPEDYLLKAREGIRHYRWLYWIRGTCFKYLLYRVLLPRADHIFVQSEQMRRDLAAEGVALQKMTAVPMGVRAPSVSAAPLVEHRQVIPEETPCFLYLGTLAKIRHLDFLIRVLVRVRESVPDAKLYLVGRGDHPSDEQFLADEALRLGVVPAVVFVGQLPQAQALRYVREADVCVSPFYPTPVLNSTSPTKLVEYMAMSKAVVASDHPEQRFLIEQSGGGLCVPYEEAAFAHAVAAMLKAPAQARMMGERGRLYVLEHRTYSAITTLVERELLRVAAAAHS